MQLKYVANLQLGVLMASSQVKSLKAVNIFVIQVAETSAK